MTEQEKLARAHQYILQLANGVDPLSGQPVGERDVVNQVRISRCLFYVADVLRSVMDGDRGAAVKKEKKRPFALTIQERSAFAFSEYPIAVSEIAKRLNGLIDEERMEKISYRAITQWLIEVGLLETVQKDDGGTRKRPTAQGAQFGIFCEQRSSATGPYEAVLYRREAQQLIVDNLDAVIECEARRKETQAQERKQKRENK